MAANLTRMTQAD